MSKFEDLLGVTLSEITVCEQEEIYFTSTLGRKWRMFHYQDCCERVTVEDICGDLDDLIGSPILLAEEVISDREEAECDYSCTWTFYKLATVKGYVTIRWYGTSNGWYSENVNFEEVV